LRGPLADTVGEIETIVGAGALALGMRIPRTSMI
jgi:hypothetical protein